MAKLLASSGGELTLPKLLADVVGASAVDSASANVGGGFAFDIKGRSLPGIIMKYRVVQDTRD